MNARPDSTILRAGTLYFGLVFAVGFALGVIRVSLLAPWLGARSAELVELPVMLYAAYHAARFVVRRLAIPRTLRVRLGVGTFALGWMLAGEYCVLRWVNGQSLSENLAARDPWSGSAYALALLLFAGMPGMLLMDGAPPRR